MDTPRYHVISQGKKWALWREHSFKAQKLFDRRDQAISAAKRYISKSFDVVIHRNDGTVSQWLQAK